MQGSVWTADVEVVGDRAYTIGRGVFRILDISNPLKPYVLGQVTGLGNARQLVIQKEVAYIGSREDGVFIIDVTDDKSPKVLTHYDSIEFATGMGISGDVLFVACRHFGVELVDISNPRKPLHLSTVRTGEAQSVTIRNGFLYAGVWATSEVVVVDVNDPRQPRITAKVPLDGYGDGLTINGEYLYAATGHHSREAHRKLGDPGFGKGHGLEIFNISNPAKPEFVSSIKFPPFYDIGNDMWGVTIVDNTAFVADTHNGMFVVDVTEKTEPKIIGRTLLPHVKNKELRSFVGALAPIDDYVCIAGGWSDLHIVEVKHLALRPILEPDTPPTITPVQQPASDDRFRVYRSDGQVHAVDFSEETAIVACGIDGIHVVQLWPNIKRLSKINSPGFAFDVSVHQSKVYVAEGKAGLAIYELSAKNELMLISRYRPERGAIKQVEVPGLGNYALIQVGSSTLEILDVSDTRSPKRVHTEKHHGLLYGDQMMRGLVDDRYSAAFWHVTGIFWIDLQNGTDSNPVYSGDNHPERFGSSNGLVALGSKTLVTVRGGYVLLDRDERRPFKELKVYRLGSRREHLGKPTIVDDRLFIANRASGLITIADVTDPENPKLIEQFHTAGHPGRLSFKNGHMIIPDGNHGLLIFEKWDTESP